MTSFLIPDKPLVRSVRAERSLDAADRQAIERDIHDGVQQRLTALKIRLGMAADRFHERGEREAELAFAELADQMDEAIDELRAIARGVYPALLASDGLGGALAAAGRRAAAPVTVTAAGTRRYPPEIELAVYFTALAAIDNAEKHAGSATIAVSISEAWGRLRFSVSDDGSGFDPGRGSRGAGLTNMRARLAAVGGSLEIESGPSCGTRVSGTVPLQCVRT